MANNEVLDSDILRARIIQLEYAGATVEEIKRIYIEETGEKPPTNITVYHSDDFDELQQIEPYSGFDGSVIHFYDEKQGINQMYTITRGSEGSEKGSWKPKDWVYNAIGIGTGQSDSQYEAARRFQQKVSTEIKQKTKDSNIPIKKMGLGHSLGGNLIVTLQLTTGQYDKVYAVNPAPPSVYNLAFIDREFRNILGFKFHFNPDNFNDIYDVNPDELAAFAKEYYKGRIDESTIQRLVLQEDLLYGLWPVRGFLDIGEGEPLSSIDGFSGLQEAFKNIPDETLRSYQLFMSQFAPAFNERGFDGFVREMTGFRPEFVDSWLRITDSWEERDYWRLYKESLNFRNQFRYTILPMIYDMKKKIPQLLEFVDHLPPILDAFVVADIMSPEERDIILKEIENIKLQLEQINSSIKSVALLSLARSPAQVMKEIYTIQYSIQSIINSYEIMKPQFQSTLEVLHVSAEAHKMDHVINALAQMEASAIERVYDSKSGDMYYMMEPTKENQQISQGIRFRGLPTLLQNQLSALFGGGRSGGPVKVNISSAVRIYQKGVHTCEQMRQDVSRLQRLYQQRYLNDFEERKRTLLDNIHEMEQNPYRYQRQFLGTFPPSAMRVHSIRKIVVNEDIQPLPRVFTHNFDAMFQHYEEEITKTETLVQQIKDTIEAMFEHDEKIAKLFGLKY